MATASHSPSPIETHPASTSGARSDQPPSRNDSGTATSAAAEPNRLARRKRRVSTRRSGSSSSPLTHATVAPLVNV